MKTVIKKGVNHYEIREVTCPKCEAQLRFTPDAWTREEVKDSFMTDAVRYFLNCPCCGTEIESNKAKCLSIDEVIDISDKSWTMHDGESI